MNKKGKKVVGRRENLLCHRQYEDDDEIQIVRNHNGAFTRNKTGLKYGPASRHVFLIELGFNDTSTLVGHFVSSPRKREKE